jgi:AraC-like DNA-binding protein
MLLPESRPLSALLQTSLNGIRIRGAAQEYLNLKIPLLESETGLGRIVCLVDCLNQVVRLGGYETVSTQEVVSFGNRGKERIDRICQFTIDHFSEPITLEQVAGLAAMSVPAFCSYFKKRTKKTYVAFLNEVRIGHACKLLMDTTMPVTEICYDSGFNTLANFNKQFLRIKKTTPSAFRKKMRAGVPLFNEV